MDQCIVFIRGLSGHSSNTVFPLQLHKLIGPVDNVFASKYSFATLTISSSFISTASSVVAVGVVCMMRIPRCTTLASELFDFSTHACISAWVSSSHLRLNMFIAAFPVFLLPLTSVNDNCTLPVAQAQILASSLILFCLTVGHSLTTNSNGSCLWN